MKQIIESKLEQLKKGLMMLYTGKIATMGLGVGVRQ